MAGTDAKRNIEGGHIGTRLSAEVERQILRAVARIDYGSVEIVVHEGEVVQIECREKFRIVRDGPGGANAPGRNHGRG
jgi:hypothetical protein